MESDYRSCKNCQYLLITSPEDFICNAFHPLDHIKDHKQLMFFNDCKDFEEVKPFNFFQKCVDIYIDDLEYFSDAQIKEYNNHIKQSSRSIIYLASKKEYDDRKRLSNLDIIENTVPSYYDIKDYLTIRWERPRFILRTNGNCPIQAQDDDYFYYLYLKNLNSNLNSTIYFFYLDVLYIDMNILIESFEIDPEEEECIIHGDIQVCQLITVNKKQNILQDNIFHQREIEESLIHF